MDLSANGRVIPSSLAVTSLEQKAENRGGSCSPDGQNWTGSVSNAPRGTAFCSRQVYDSARAKNESNTRSTARVRKKERDQVFAGAAGKRTTWAAAVSFTGKASCGL